MKTTRQVAKALLSGALIILSTLAPINWATAQTCVQPPSGLISWWPGDGNADDIQDNNPGALLNGVTFASGLIGQAFSFDGLDDEVLVPYATNLNDTQAITIAAWVNVNSLTNNVNGGYQAVVSISEGQRAYILAITGTGDNHVGTAGNIHLEGSGLGLAWRTSVAAITAGQWYHIAGVIEPSTNRFEIYVNGVLQTLVSSNGAPQLALASGVPFRLGYSDPYAPYHFAGLIDDVGLYNRALSAAEILNIFNAGSAGMCIDSDGDGVIDVDDVCQATLPGEIVNSSGCSIGDLCPCDNSWKNHGAYVSCVSHATEGFVADGLLTELEKDLIVSDAALSSCGKGTIR